jgi:uncharacterized membrane protein
MNHFAALLWRPHLSPLWCGLLMFAAGIWLWLVYRRMLTRLEPRRARWLLVPRLLACLLLLIALCEPVWHVETYERVHGKLLVLVDTSASMEVSDDGKQTRLARALAVVQRLKRDLPADIQLEQRDFNTELMKAGEGARSPVRGTDLGGVLAALADRQDGPSSLGVVLITDGGDEPVEGALLPPVPLYAIGIGAKPDDWNDVAIAEVSFPATVEKGVEFEISVDLTARARGAGNFLAQLRRVPVQLEEQVGGQWKAVADQTVDLSNRRARVKFNAVIRELGLRHYRVMARPVRGELTTLNNTRHLAVEAQKKSLHLLYFSRELGMDFKTLRGELGRDPGVAFTALFRTLSERFTLQGDRMPGDEELEAGFPSSEKTLQLYECVILGSFAAEDWLPEQMKALRKYVEGGGVVIFLGGAKSFGSGGYARTDLAGLLPWRITDNETVLAAGVFPVKVPVAAAGHPVVSGVEEILIREGAAVESLNLVGEVKPGATALLEARVDGRSLAVVVMQNFGKGKVLAIASNTLWKWGTRSEALRTAYGQFWRQAVRHLAGREEGGRVFTVKWDKEEYRPGDIASPEIRVAGQSFPEGLRFTASLGFKQATVPQGVEPLQGQPNTWTSRLRLRERGDYEFKLTAYRGDAAQETYTKSLRISPAMDEGAHIELNEASLKKLAERTSGAFYREDEAAQLIQRVTTGAGRKTVAQEASVAQAGPWFALLFLLVLAAEWYLRRRNHLI